MAWLSSKLSRYDYTYGPELHYSYRERIAIQNKQESLNELTKYKFITKDRELIILARDFGIDEQIANKIIYNTKKQFIDNIDDLETKYGSNLLDKYYETTRLRLLSIAFEE
jgi:hypothetical protein